MRRWQDEPLFSNFFWTYFWLTSTTATSLRSFYPTEVGKERCVRSANVNSVLSFRSPIWIEATTTAHVRWVPSALDCLILTQRSTGKHLFPRCSDAIMFNLKFSLIFTVTFEIDNIDSTDWWSCRTRKHQLLGFKCFFKTRYKHPLFFADQFITCFSSFLNWLSTGAGFLLQVLLVYFFRLFYRFRYFLAFRCFSPTLRRIVSNRLFDLRLLLWLDRNLSRPSNKQTGHHLTSGLYRFPIVHSVTFLFWYVGYRLCYVRNMRFGKACNIDASITNTIDSIFLHNWFIWVSLKKA